MSPIEVPAKIQLVEKRETRTSRGMLSKGWYRVDDQLVMVKGNSITEAGTAGYEPYSEVMASLIAQVLGLPHVEYALMPAKLFPDIKTYSCDVRGLSYETFAEACSHCPRICFGIEPQPDCLSRRRLWAGSYGK